MREGRESAFCSARLGTASVPRRAREPRQGSEQTWKFVTYVTEDELVADTRTPRVRWDRICTRREQPDTRVCRQMGYMSLCVLLSVLVVRVAHVSDEPDQAHGRGQNGTTAFHRPLRSLARTLTTADGQTCGLGKFAHTTHDTSVSLTHRRSGREVHHEVAQIWRKISATSEVHERQFLL